MLQDHAQHLVPPLWQNSWILLWFMRKKLLLLLFVVVQAAGHSLLLNCESLRYIFLRTTHHHSPLSASLSLSPPLSHVRPSCVAVVSLARFQSISNPPPPYT